MEQEPIGGSSFFLFMVVYFRQSKTEVLKCFKEYKAQMENLTGKIIKLHIDDGTE